ncbi:hypothetical protein ACFL1X_02310 [Candidatus Hydrogenedentota bacterium]
MTGQGAYRRLTIRVEDASSNVNRHFRRVCFMALFVWQVSFLRM